MTISGSVSGNARPLTVGGAGNVDDLSGRHRHDGTGGHLTKTGTGTLTLSGANTYSGATTINGGHDKARGANIQAPCRRPARRSS